MTQHSLKLCPKGLVEIPSISLQHLCISFSLKRNATMVAIQQVRFLLPQHPNNPLKYKKAASSLHILVKIPLDYIQLCLAIPIGKYHTNK